MKIRKLVKIIFLIVLFVFEGIMSLVMTDIARTEYASGTLSYGLAAVVMFYMFSLITMAELLRMMFGKEHIIIPMLGMYVTAFTLGIGAGMFADFFTSGDKGALGAGITFAIFTLLLFGAGVGIHLKEKVKIADKTRSEHAVPKYMFDRFDAEWYWDDVLAEYCHLYIAGDPDDEMRDGEGRMLDEYTDKLYIYCCNYIAYLFLWLARREGLSRDLLSGFDAGKVDDLLNKQTDPAEFIYYNMDGKLCRDDVTLDYLMFLNEYYEYLTYGDAVRKVSYRKDYDEIIRGSVHDDNDGGKETGEIRYCLDFSWDKYAVFEKRLDMRFEDYLRDRPYEYMEKLDRKIYSEGLRQELEIFRQELVPGFFPDIKAQAYDRYVEDCLKHVAYFPADLIRKICDKLLEEWGPDWVDESIYENFLSQIDCGEIDIYYPYGDEIAYVLCFEAEFESEHGISIGIRGDEVLFVAYRMDGETPWGELA